jgi:hypothetical protein
MAAGSISWEAARNSRDQQGSRPVRVEQQAHRPCRVGGSPAPGHLVNA